MQRRRYPPLRSVSTTPDIPPVAPNSSGSGSTTRTTSRRRTRANEDTLDHGHGHDPRQLHPSPHQQPQHPIHPSVFTPNSIVEAHQNGFPYPVYAPGLQPPQRPLHTAPGPPQTWQQSVGIAPQQTHLAPPQHIQVPNLIHRQSWNGYEGAQPADPMAGPSNGTYDYRYRDEPPTWVTGSESYYAHVKYFRFSIRHLCANWW